VHDTSATVSGGQRQRLGLARAVFGSPALLVLDEPDASLDHAGDAALRAAIAAVRAAGGIVVLTTHRPQLLGIVDDIVTLRAGRIDPASQPDTLPARTGATA
jgi:ABC-type protease/lipase transport system fused ATPase/permease subunit